MRSSRSKSEAQAYHLQLQDGITRYEIETSKGTISIMPRGANPPHVTAVKPNGKKLGVGKSKPFSHGNHPETARTYHCHVFYIYDLDPMLPDPIAILVICH